MKSVKGVHAPNESRSTLKVDSPTIDEGDDEYKIQKTDGNDALIRILPPNDHPQSRLFGYLPILYWLPKYNIKAHLTGDCIAGLTAGIMLIPQGMAYSLIAGLDPIYGLYASMLGPLIYPIFGTSGQLSVAPVAILSLLVAEGIDSQIDADEDDKDYDSKALGIASILGFQVGLVQIVLGLLNAGMLASMLSHSVIVGFTGAAAFLIGMSQMQYCLKLEIKRGEFFIMLIDIFANFDKIHWQTVLMSLVCILILLFIRTWKQKKNWWGNKNAKFVPGALIVVILSTLVCYAINDKDLFDIVGKQKNGLPSPANMFSDINSNQFWALWTTSILMSMIGFLESYAVANKFAEEKDYSVNPSQEFFALGMCNFLSSWFTCFPMTGALSRTAVAEAAGANMPIASIIAGILILLALMVLLPLFEWLPRACLGAIVVVSVINLFDYKAMMHLWKVKKQDFWVMLITLLITLSLGIETGVAAGVITSLLVFIQRESKPHYAILGELPDEDGVWRNVKTFKNARPRNDVLVIRWDASLFFANIDIFKKRILKHIGRFLDEHDYPKQWCLILNFQGINDCDASAAEKLQAFFHDLNHKFDGYQLLITNLKKPVALIFEVSEVMKVVKEDHVFFEMKDAIKYWENYVLSIDTEGGSSEKSTGKQDVENLLNDDAVAKQEKSNQIIPVKDTEELENEPEPDDDNDPDADDKINDGDAGNVGTEDPTDENEQNGYVE